MKAPGIFLFSAAALVLAGTGAARAGSVAPVGGDAFNVKAEIDLTKLTREDFDAMVTPVAKTETAHELVFYDFADTLCDLLAGEVARFTKETGIPAKHVCVDGDAATQQLIAAKQANAEAPADVFFGPNNSMRALTAAGVVANIPLVDVLPNAAKLEPNAAQTSRGFSHGGTVLPFHRNQTVLAYNSAIVKALPDTLQGVFDYARANNVKVAITNPTEGGSGSGFLETAMLALAPDCQGDLYDFSLSEDQAKAVARKCMAPVVAYFKEQKPLIEFTNGNEASLQAIANNVAPIATVWEDDLYTLAGKGLVPKETRPALLKTGEVGDGDGLFIVASTPSAEASLLLANFLMSDEVQIGKMEKTGSRTARLDLSTAGKIPANLASFLVPDQQYQERTKPRINGLISDAAADIFVKEVIAQ
ncbi:MAG TPA: extracellular solute-binding protein [Dongiaceae bacterium]|jgi:multiple sugar transport system substrate-binding protein/putative spermidine/putrescine transport system substrate-binding protein|nr:extracellular solute-binding protein [Dongiaceae bacterium]